MPREAPWEKKGVDLSRFFPPDDKPTVSKYAHREAFLSAAQEAGLRIKHIVPDELQRVPDTEDTGSEKTGWYIFFEGPEISAGVYGSWHQGYEWKSWCSVHENELTEIQLEVHRRYLESAQKAREEERKRLAEDARQRIRFLSQNAQQATAEHPYLKKKKIESHGTLTSEQGVLIIPMQNTDGEPVTAQTITADGTKRFLHGGQAKGTWFQLGAPTQRVWITEGFATGATVHQATGDLTLVAFNCGNLKPVAQAARKRFPNASICIAADNDQWTDKNPGLSKATEAAAAVSATLKVPQFQDVSARPTDFNDLYLLEGLAAVREILTEAGTPPIALIYYDDIKPVEAQGSIVNNVLLERQMSVIYGPSGIGKSFFMLDLALHAAAGKLWHGHKTDQCGVVYIATEGGFGAQNRICAWKEYYGLEGLPFALVPSTVDLLHPNADTPRLIDAIKGATEKLGIPIGLVITDTLSRAMAGGNENASEDMGSLVINGDRIRSETGCHLAWIHHSGKDQAKGARGHSLLRAATDTEIELSINNGTTHAVATKQRELDSGHVLSFDLSQFTLSNDQTSCIIVPHIQIDRPESLTPKETEVYETFLDLMIEVPENGVTIDPGYAGYGVGKGTLRNQLSHRGVTKRNRGQQEKALFWKHIKSLVNKGKLTVEGEWILKA